jgi:hypothetical protein
LDPRLMVKVPAIGQVSINALTVIKGGLFTTLEPSEKLDMPGTYGQYGGMGWRSSRAPSRCAPEDHMGAAAPP